MTNELDLLRTFRSDIPGPSTDAWARARAAIALAEATTTTSAEADPPLGPERPRSAWHRWRMPVAASAAAAVLLLGLLVGIGVIGGGGRALSRPFTTAWKAGRPFVVTSSGHTATRHGTWRLVDALLTGTWQQNVYGPPPGLLSCSPDGTCYVLSAKYLSASAATPVSRTLYVSTNAGGTWSAFPVPSGLAPTTPLECSGSQWCAAGGTYDGQPVLAVTSDGGHSFTIDPLPTGVGSVSTLSCPATDVCMALVSSGTSSTTSTPPDATLLVTNDGGASFHDEPVLSGDSMIDLACSSSTDCTAVGVTDASMGTRPPVGVSAVTANQGRTWTKGSLPVGLGITRTLSGLACPDAQHCFVMGYLPMRTANPPQCASTNVPTSQGQATSLPAMSPAAKALSERETKIVEAEAAKPAPRNVTMCSSNETTQFSVIAKSSDGGATWTLETPPSDVPRPYLGGLACPTATECWAGGQESVPVKVGKIGVDMASSVLIGTTDGGSTWSKVVFSTPATAPNPTGQSYLSMGSVTCPTASVCLAHGMAAQNANYAPVYSLVVPGG